MYEGLVLLLLSCIYPSNIDRYILPTQRMTNMIGIIRYFNPPGQDGILKACVRDIINPDIEIAGVVVQYIPSLVGLEYGDTVEIAFIEGRYCVTRIIKRYNDADK
jgi:hypothetical protein